MAWITARAELRTLQGKMADAVAARHDADITAFSCPFGGDATLPETADFAAGLVKFRAESLGATLVGRMVRTGKQVTRAEGSKPSASSSDAEPILLEGAA